MQLLTAAVSFFLSLAFVPLVRQLSFKLGKVKQPRQDRWHRQSTPTMGGIAIFAAFWGGLIVSLLNSGAFSASYLSLLIGTGIAFFVGLIDDLHPLTPPVKLGGQIVAATVVIFFGNQTIRFFPWPIANILLTYLWLIGITNSINLLDNIDGLATGVSIIAAALLGVFLWKDQNYFLLLVDLALMGALLGFLVFNFPPAKIFMGDSGSLFIGFLLASLAVYRKSQASSVFAVFGVPILIFLLPILDTTLVTFTRLLRGQSPTQGGTDHTSHRLVSFGLNEVQTLLILYAIALIGGCSAIILEAIDYDTSLVLIPIVLITLSLAAAYLGNLKIVTSPKTGSGNVSRWMSELAYRRRLFEILLDLGLVTTSYYLAYWLSYGLNMTSISMGLFLQSWPLALVSAYVMFFLVGVYRGVWRYHGIDDLLRFVGAALGTAIMTFLLVLLLFPNQGYSLEVYILFAVILILGLSGSRSTFVILDRYYYKQRIVKDGDRILLLGAGDEGEIALRWILRNPEIGYRPVGFVDNDQSLWGRSINSVEILGGCEKITDLIDNGRIDGIVITSSRFNDQPDMQRILALCHQRSVWIRYLRIDFELIEAD